MGFICKMNTVVYKTLLAFGISLSVLSCTNSTSEKSKSKAVEYQRHVGDILFDPNIDDHNFKPCHEDLAPQYYSFGKGIMYKGEKPELIRQIKEAYKNAENGKENAYITIRFIVNCEGKSGWFRLQELDTDYKAKEVHSSIAKELLEIVKSLNGWEAGSYEDRYYDYYQYLTFKIVDGQIQSILP